MLCSPKVGRIVAAASLLSAALGVSSPARAVTCSSLPSPVYGIGGSGPKPVIAKLATALGKANPAQTIIYQYPGACVGPATIFAGTAMTGTASYWDANGKEQTCSLDILGNTADFGAGGNLATHCSNLPPQPANVVEFKGAVQPFEFFVNKASAETSISAAAAYFIWGFGNAGQAAPWTDETLISKRDTNSAAAIAVGLAIGVPVAKFHGVDTKSNAGSVSFVATAAGNLQAAIGFASGETVDASLGSINVLAYQHWNQTCGYWPSSTSSSFDKQNVRNGHYALWANMRFYAVVDGAGNPVSPGAANVIGYFRGTVAAPAGVNPLVLQIQGGAIPDCAMQVQRADDLGNLTPYAPAAPCGCFFEATATGASTCATCSSNADCSANAPNCRYGYCEVH